MLFLHRAHSSARPPLDSNPLPSDYETRALTNAPLGTVAKPEDKLSEQKHLRQSLNQCGYKNSIINHAISYNKSHNSKTATLIQKNKCYVAVPYHGELSEEVK